MAYTEHSARPSAEHVDAEIEQFKLTSKKDKETRLEMDLEERERLMRRLEFLDKEIPRLKNELNWKP